MRPIPKRLLPDTAEVRVIDPGADYDGVYLAPVELEGVRYERTASIRKTEYQLQDGTTGIVFVDAINTKGAFEIPAGALIKIGDTETCVSATHRFEGFNGRVHHWELEVK